MRKVLKFLLAVFLLPLLMACENKNGDVNDYLIDIATVQNPDTLTKFFFKLDNGMLMWAQESNFANLKPKNGQRIVANYTIISDKRATKLYSYDVKINDYYIVLTKGIFNVTKATQDSIGNDSISIQSIWIGSDYLNIQYSYTGYTKTHFINLVNDTSKVFNDGEIHLYFRHNSNNDSPVSSFSAIVSFNLKSLQTGASGTSLPLVIHANLPYQADEETFNLTYDFGATSSIRKHLVKLHTPHEIK